jgi:hypothetical protein
MSVKDNYYLDTFRIHAATSGFMRGVELAATIQGRDGKEYRLEDVLIDPVPCKEGYRLKPFLELTNEQAQQLMDDLYFAGVRPSDLRDSSGELKATKYHLEDMRQLAGVKK